MLYFANTTAVLISTPAQRGDRRWWVEPHRGALLQPYGYLWGLGFGTFLFLPRCPAAAPFRLLVGTEADLKAVIGRAAGIVFPAGPVF